MDYLSTNIMFWTLSIVLSLSKNRYLFFKTQRFGDWILSPSFLSPEIGTSSINWAQLSRFYLKTEIESSL
jgi:hypothetical protein